MRIASPSYLLLLWLVPVLAAFYLWSFRRRAQLLEKFASNAMLARLLPPVSQKRQRAKAALISTAVVMIVLALLRPQWGFHWEEITRRGVDIMVAVDVSQSMLAKDVSPNRLERAKRELEDLLDILQGDRVGLIAFAGEAWVQCPLTLDYGAFAMFLDYLSPDLIPVPGTAIAQAIDLATKSFVDQSSASRALILVTDGEDHAGKVLEAAKRAKEAGIEIYTIGIGAEQGAPIPSPDGNGFIKDENGEVVMTKLDESTLERVAVETGGAYVRSTTGNLDLEKIYTEGIRSSLTPTELKSTRQKKWEERFQWPLFVAVLIVMLEPFLSEQGKIRRRIVQAGVAAAALMAFWPIPARAGLLRDSTIEDAIEAYQAEDYETALQKFTDAGIEHPDDPLLEYNMGNAYYKTRRFDEAEAAYLHVIARSTDTSLKEQALYNLGNTAFRQGKLDKAVEYYEGALKIDPNDMDAKRNLEIARREIQRRLDEARKQQEQQQKQKKQGEQNPQSGQKNQQNQAGSQGQQASQNQQRAGEQPTPSPEESGKQASAGGASPTPGPEGNQKQAEGAGATPAPTPGTVRPANEGSQQQDAQNDQEARKATARVGRLSREEAERLLSQVPDARKTALRAPQHGQAVRPPGGKPW